MDSLGNPKPAYAAAKRMFDEIDPLQQPGTTAQRAVSR
jgi:hypothetical protein